MLPLLAASWATPLDISTATTPSVDGVTLNEYELPDPLKLETLPLETVTSVDVNPVTFSLKLTEMGIGVLSVGEDSVDEIETVGFVPSYVILNC